MKIEFFCTFFVILSLSKSSAVIPDCDYFDTVDLSHMERQNGSYQYEGIVIPDNRIGEYGFKMVPFEQRLTVTTHLRGCVCELRTCIRICCPRKNMLPNGGCSDGLNDQLLQVNPHLYVNNEDDTLSVLYLNNQTLLRTQLWGGDRMVYLLGDQYTLYKNGTLILNYQNMELKKEEYCLHPNQFKSRYSAGLWFVLHETIVIPLPGVLGIIGISMMCYILTIAVYISVKKLRNVLGKCLICSMFSLFMTDLSFLIDEYRFLSNVCLLAGYCSYFFDFAFILWNSVISYHLWKTLTSVNRDEPRQRFLAYSAFVWVTAAIPTGAIFIINQFYVNDLNNWNWMPLVGFSRCAVDIFKGSAWIYYHGPILILNIFIFIMFILTARNILKVKRKLKKIAHRRDGITTCFNYNSENYLLFLRLFTMMGVHWILYLLYLSDFKNELWHSILTAMKYFQCAFGIFVFVLLILKRSSIQLLKDRIRGNSSSSTPTFKEQKKSVFY